MALENRLWGYERIEGEIKKLGHKLSRSTVRNILSPPTALRIGDSWRVLGAMQQEPAGALPGRLLKGHNNVHLKTVRKVHAGRRKHRRTNGVVGS